MRLEGQWASFPWCPGTDSVGKAIFAACGDIVRALDPGPGPPWRHDVLIPRRHPLKTAGGGGSLCLGRLCAGRLRSARRHRPRPRSWPRAPLATRRAHPEEAPPQDHRWRRRPAPRSTLCRPSSQRAATSPAPSILAPGSLGDATPSSRGGTP
jgi:hypothetical protein